MWISDACTTGWETARSTPAWAAGAELSVHPYWGATLYHPDELPASMQPSGNGAAPSGSLDAGLSAGEELGLTRDRRRFSALPPVMTDFRKVSTSIVLQGCRAQLPTSRSRASGPGPAIVLRGLTAQFPTSCSRALVLRSQHRAPGLQGSGPNLVR